MHPSNPPSPRRLAGAPFLPWPWPLPALLAWGGGWCALLLAAQAGFAPGVGLGLGVAASLALALHSSGRWRRGIAALGFPLSALALPGSTTVPAWAWGLALLPLLLLYPLRAWRDAPFFPTPGDGLAGLDSCIGTPAPQSVLDAGCGLGHGLRELQRLWPQAALHGLEWSRPLAWASAWRCPRARIRRGDMWAADWSAHDLVYLFQRPESMARAAAKAVHELAPGAWLVSLEFPLSAVPDGLVLHAGLNTTPAVGAQTRPVWVYRRVAAPRSMKQARGR
jgi:hypothetical protein